MYRASGKLGHTETSPVASRSAAGRWGGGWEAPVDILARELGFDRTRLLGWGLAQAILAAWWCIEDHGQGWEGFVRCAELINGAMD